MIATHKIETVNFGSKGQVVIPRRLRREFEIEEGTRAAVVATPEGILLKPVTGAFIRRGRGILKRKSGDQPLAAEMAAHKKREQELEDRHAR